MAAGATFQGAVAAPTVTGVQDPGLSTTVSDINNFLGTATKLAGVVGEQAEIEKKKAAPLDKINAARDHNIFVASLDGKTFKEKRQAIDTRNIKQTKAFKEGSLSEAGALVSLSNLENYRASNEDGYRQEMTDDEVSSAVLEGTAQTVEVSLEQSVNDNKELNPNGIASKVELAGGYIKGAGDNFANMYAGVNTKAQLKEVKLFIAEEKKKYAGVKGLDSQSKLLAPSIKYYNTKIVAAEKAANTRIVKEAKDFIANAENKNAGDPNDKYNIPNGQALEERFKTAYGDQWEIKYDEYVDGQVDNANSIEVTNNYDVKTDVMPADATDSTKEMVKKKIQENIIHNIASGNWSDASATIVTQGDNAKSTIDYLKAGASSSDPAEALGYHQSIYNIISDPDTGNTAFKVMYPNEADRADFLALDFIAQKFTKMDLSEARKMIDDKNNSEYTDSKNEKRKVGNLKEGLSPNKKKEVDVLYNILRQKNISSSDAITMIEDKAIQTNTYGGIDVDGDASFPDQTGAMLGQKQLDFVFEGIKETEKLHPENTEFTYSLDSKNGSVIQYSQEGRVLSVFDREEMLFYANNVTAMKKYSNNHKVRKFFNDYGEVYATFWNDPGQIAKILGATSLEKPTGPRKLDTPDKAWNFLASEYTFGKGFR